MQQIKAGKIIHDSDFFVFEVWIPTARKIKTK